MRRSDFGNWGASLPEEGFWQAVAALGVTEGTGFPPGTLRHLLRRVDDGYPLVWRFPSRDLLRERPPRPQNWRALLDGRERQGWPRLEIEPPGDRDLGELVQGLLRHAARSLYVALPPLDSVPPAPWRRPLRLGFLPGAPAGELARQLPGRVEVVQIGDSPLRSFDLLALPASLAEARKVLATSPVAVEATALLLLGGSAVEWGSAMQQVEELRELTQARAVVSATVRGGEEEGWLGAVTESLARGLPLDLALQASGFAAEGAPTVLFAEPGLVACHNEPVRAIFRAPPERGWPRERKGPDDDFKPPFGAYSVGREEPLTRAPREKEKEGRFLQARVLERGETVGAVEPGRSYDVAVRIGPPERGALVAGREFPALEPSEEGHLLTVVFSAPGLLDKPRMKTIRLPRRGPSTVCTFPLPLRPETREVSARLTVLHDNRVLQTALLEGRVGAPLSLAVEMDVRPGMRNLNPERPFDGALILGHGPGGAATTTVAGGYRPATFSVVGLDEAIEEMEARINGTPWDDPDFASFDAPGSVELLVFLATHGERLYRELLRYDPDHPFFTGDGPVQLISSEHGARLPLELLYSRAAPDEDAVLCPHWREALATGACACPDDGSVVCPLGFWCFRRVIERHRFSPDHAAQTKGRAYALRDVAPGDDAAVLQPLAGLALGASQRVGAVDGALEALAEAVRRTCPRPVAPARDWDDWRRQVQAASPALLVLLPHTDKDARLLPTLEIGGKALASNQLRREHVLGPAGHPKPVVLLLGCNTDNAGLPFESFVPSFADQQAAVIVTSLSKVLGRHAAPLAALFLEQIAAFPGNGRHRFGEVMREVRRRAALSGPPLALVLKAYGDADWRI